MGDRLKIFNVNSYSFSKPIFFYLLVNYLTSNSISLYFLSNLILRYSFSYLIFISFRNMFLSNMVCRLVFWKSIHLEVASGPFCLLVNSSWLLVFALCVFYLSLFGFNLYCWRGIHFSWS